MVKQSISQSVPCGPHETIGCPTCLLETFLNKEGIKHDAEKPAMDLIPPEAMFALANVLSYGEKKYTSRNWEKGMSWGRVFGGIMRHLWAWWGGQDKDPESGYSHLHHALAGVCFLVAYEARGVGKDTRNPTLPEK